MNTYPLKPEIAIPQYAISAREKTAKEFDERNKDQLEKTLGELQKILTVKLMIVARGCDFGTAARYDGFALTKSALDVLVSALHLARQRGRVETYSLLRVALECSSTGLHILHDPIAYESYKTGKYRSTTAISFAKKFVPFVGEIWGALSQVAVHINILGHGPQITSDENGELVRSVVLEYGGRKHQDVQDKLLLTSICLVANIVLKMAELILFEKHPEHEAALRLIGTDTIYIGNTDKRIVDYDNELKSYVTSVLQPK